VSFGLRKGKRGLEEGGGRNTTRRRTRERIKKAAHSHRRIAQERGKPGSIQLTKKKIRQRKKRKSRSPCEERSQDLRLHKKEGGETPYPRKEAKTKKGRGGPKKTPSADKGGGAHLFSSKKKKTFLLP